MTDKREMTLKEWCAKLPKCHLVNVELQQLEQDKADLELAVHTSLANLNDEISGLKKDKVEMLEALNQIAAIMHHGG